MNVKSLLLIAASSCLCVSSCGSTKIDKPEAGKEEVKSPPVEGPKLVGRVASIPPDQKFVLIQSYGKWVAEIGQILTTRGPDNRTSNLRTTGEKLGEFAAADVQSGLVELGDAVYFQHVPKPVAPPTPTEPSQPEGNANVENVQKNN